MVRQADQGPGANVPTEPQDSTHGDWTEAETNGNFPEWAALPRGKDGRLILEATSTPPTDPYAGATAGMRSEVDLRGISPGGLGYDANGNARDID